MARPREFDEDAVIDAIKNVFWEKGYEGASYADLIDASGLHKGSLYAAFGDKRALYLRALRAYDEHEVDGAIELLTDGDAKQKGEKRIEALLNAVIGAVVVDGDRRGCLLCNAAIDQAPHDEDVEKSISGSIERLQRAFEKALSADRKGAALKEAASLANAAYFGMRVMAKSGVPIAMMKQARNGLLKRL